MLSRVLVSVLLLRAAAAGARRAARSLCSGSRDQRRQLGGQHGEEAAEVLGVPGAGQVGLAEADQPVAAEPGEELRRAGARSSPGRPGPSVRVRSRPRRRTVTASRLTAARNSRRATARRDARRGARSGTASRPGQVVAGRAGRGRGSCRLLPAWWSGRGRTGSRRAHSQMPWAFGSSSAAAQGGRARRAAATRRCGVPVERGAERRAPSSVCRVTATCEPVAGHAARRARRCRRCRGTARRTSPCRRAWPGPARRGGRGRRAGRRRCCAPRRRWPPGRPSRSKHQNTLIGLKQ